MSDESFHINFITASDQSKALTRIIRKQLPISERSVVALFEILGRAVGFMFVLVIALGVAAIVLGIMGGPIEYITARVGRAFEIPVGVALFVMPFCIFYLLILRWIRRILRSNIVPEDQPRSVDLKIDGRGIIEREENCSSILAWAAIQRILSDDRNVFLFVGERRAFVIPRAAFDQPADADRLIDLAKRSISERINSPPFRSEWLTQY